MQLEFPFVVEESQAFASAIYKDIDRSIDGRKYQFLFNIPQRKSDTMIMLEEALNREIRKMYRSEISVIDEVVLTPDETLLQLEKIIK